MKIFKKLHPFWILAFILILPYALFRLFSFPGAGLHGFYKIYFPLFWFFYFALFGMLTVISAFEWKALGKMVSERGLVYTAEEWLPQFFGEFKSMPLRLLSNLLLFAFFYIIIIESFLYFPLKDIYRVILAVQAFVSFVTLYIHPRKKYLRKLGGGFKVLSITILVFLSSIFTSFEKQFLQDGDYIDRVLFSDFAARHGRNIQPLLKDRIENKVLSLNQAPPGQYVDTLHDYTRRLAKGTLTEDLWPEKSIGNTVSIHSLFTGKALGYLGNEGLSPGQRQAVMGALLDYLIAAAGSPRFEAVKEDPDHPVKSQLLLRIAELIETRRAGSPGVFAGKLERLHRELVTRTSLNPYMIKELIR